MGAHYFIFDNGIAEVATVNEQLICINKPDKKVVCPQI